LTRLPYRSQRSIRLATPALGRRSPSEPVLATGLSERPLHLGQREGRCRSMSTEHRLRRGPRGYRSSGKRYGGRISLGKPGDMAVGSPGLCASRRRRVRVSGFGASRNRSTASTGSVARTRRYRSAACHGAWQRIRMSQRFTPRAEMSSTGRPRELNCGRTLSASPTTSHTAAAGSTAVRKAVRTPVSVSARKTAGIVVK
jgi:hypothetical protein